MLYTERAHFYHRYKVPPIFYLINVNAVRFGLKALVSLRLDPPVRGGVHLMLFHCKSYFKTETKQNSWMFLNLHIMSFLANHLSRKRIQMDL
jgi:hypothetical protein